MINGTMDKFLPLTVLELNPSIFQNSSNNKMFRWWVFWVTLIDSMWQSAVQYFIPYFTYAITSESYLGEQLETGSSISFYCFGTIVANASLFRSVFYLSEIEINGYFSQFLHLGIETFTWTWLHFTAIIISYLLFYIFGIVSGVLHGTGQGEYYAMIYLLAQPTTYLTGKNKPRKNSCLSIFSTSDWMCVSATPSNAYSLHKRDQSKQMVYSTQENSSKIKVPHHLNILQNSFKCVKIKL